MTSPYGALPTFTHGQVLSASHLNALQSYVQALHDAALGQTMPFLAWQWYGDVPVSKSWTGILRHKYDSFKYKYVITDGYGACTIKINNVAVATSTGPGTYTATVDISGLGLVAGQFYDVIFAIANVGSQEGHASVQYMYESYAPAVYTLASFADETIPSAAAWNYLCAYATDLANLSTAPQPCGFKTTGRYQNMLGSCNHHARYLAYSFSRTRPYHDDGGLWADTKIYINGSLALRRVVGGPAQVGTGEDFDQNAGDTCTWSGLLDLDAHPGGLVIGHDYDIILSSDGAGESFGSQQWDHWFYLYELPEANPGGFFWQTFTAWTHGAWVRGNSSVPQIVTIKDNLDAIAACSNYRNYPAPTDNGAGLYGIRRWRWLHYRTYPQDNRSHATDDDPYDPLPPTGTPTITESPTLIYNYMGKEKKVSLSDAYEQWLWLDLDSVEGLDPGIPYALENVRYALEDEVI